MGINIALAGNPNCGKTTMFNELTGANQYVGNWPGVTVEKKEGKYTRDKDVTVTDLPGVYSLSPYTPEEIVTRDYLLSGQPDVVVNLVDATNLERNLYLTTQILDLGLPVVVALNMMDLVRKNGDEINVEGLSQRLGCPVVETTALKGRGVEELIAKAVEAAKAGQPATPELRFSGDAEAALAQVSEILGSRVKPAQARWFAIKLLEGEELTIDALSLPADDLARIDAIREALEEAEDDDAESIVTNERYDNIGDVCAACVKKSPKAMTTTQKIDRVVTNRILGIPIFVVIMFLVYYISVSTVGTLVTDWANDGLFGDGWLYTNTESYEADAEEYEGYQAQIDACLEAAEEDGLDVEGFTAALEAEEPNAEDEEVIENFMYAAASAGVEGEMEVEDEETGEVAIEAIDSAAFAKALEAEEPDPADYGFYHVGVPVVVGGWLEAIDAAPWIQSLILDGIIAGVGAVIGFIPQLIVLFILLGILEGCGYMARVAFIMDRIFRRFGLSGKSFIPMLIASGCGVPAVMATKTIENEKDRRMTIMTTTMIPCGAKLPIIALVFGALAGGDYEATWWVAPLFYFLGLAAIILSCIILKKFKAFAGEVAPFIMELPQYHIPTAKNVLLSMWERVRSYVVKAGTIIFLSSMVIWFLLNFGFYEGQFGLLDPDMDDYIQYSLMAGLGNLLAWVFAPLGFGTWESTVTSITGLVAKENVVATVGVITSLGEAGETDPSLWASFAAMLGGGSAAIMAFCAFNLLCAPCFAAIGTIRRQMMSAKWTWATIGYLCGFAWCVGLMIYQLGGLALGEVDFSLWTVVALAVLAGMLFLLLRPAPRPKQDKVAAGTAAQNA
ncbi:ferrous iron transporter B [Enterorhabdus sp. P55]|uniref:ferrous iron transporter B n=1 Tax=Enterorhabdus sp. P55 TaxID=2304571 RepID=UPI00136B774C|nr:ferrous iron transporter B [Enterorhabdus sp. P55]NBI31493.1 ferrous iron transporter B [Enterorhabdus sp. P55]